MLLGIVAYATVIAQNVTIRFEGTANSSANNSRDYAVDLDGRWYYSSNAEATGAQGMTQIVIDNLSLGTHQFSVYEVNSTSNTTANEPLYSKAFQLRSGYDMIIAVRRNGTVTFTERKMKQGATTASSATAMADAEFTKLLASVKAKWSQSSRYTALKSAFANKAYYFSTEQVGDLLMLVTSETRRLELAKLAYPKVTDQSNFADVGELFTTQTNKDNFDTFVRSKNPDIASDYEINSNGYRTPVTAQKFNQLLRQTRNQYRQEGKVAVLNDAFAVTTNYYTTAQLRQLLTLITSETDKLALAKKAYAQVSDEQNFASLYDLFTTQANRDEFNNYVRYGGSLTSTGQYASRVAMSDADFSKLYSKARLHFRQSSVTADVKEALSNKSNYFTVTQIRSLLSLISPEADRLTLAKLAYHRAADPGNFTQLFDLFTTQSNVDDLNNYIRTNPS